MRRRSLYPLPILALLSFLAAACSVAGTSGEVPRAAGAVAPTTVILVRHAEKESGAGDVALSAAGRARAAALVEALQDARVDAVLATQYRRTRETAEPLATGLGLEVETVAVERGAVEAHIEAVASAVERLRGRRVLVVGHSNTLPLIARRLGVTVPDLADSEYDHLWIVTLPAAGPVEVVRARFGAPAR